MWGFLGTEPQSGLLLHHLQPSWVWPDFQPRLCGLREVSSSRGELKEHSCRRETPGFWKHETELNERGYRVFSVTQSWGHGAWGASLHPNLVLFLPSFRSSWGSSWLLGRHPWQNAPCCLRCQLTVFSTPSKWPSPAGSLYPSNTWVLWILEVPPFPLTYTHLPC